MQEMPLRQSIQIGRNVDDPVGVLIWRRVESEFNAHRQHGGVFLRHLVSDAAQAIGAGTGSKQLLELEHPQQAGTPERGVIAFFR
jgi:hypothetical protein